MNTYNVEILDEYMFLQEEANDHQIRVVIEFDGKMDDDKLRYAVKESFQYVPLLACKLVRNGTRLYWEETDCGGLEKRYFNVIEGDIPSLRIKEILEKKADQYAGPQLLVTVLRSQKNDILIITVNHMVLDGSGFKKYLTLLSRIYNGIAIHKNEIPANRDVYSVLKNLKKKRNHIQANKLKVSRLLPENNDLNSNSMLFTQKIGQSEFMEIQKYCKAKKVTVNDYLMTVFFSALIGAGYFKLNTAAVMSMMIDARRYDRNNILSPYINASSMENVAVFCGSQDEEKLLSQIHSELEKIKRNMPGYKNLMDLKFFRSILPKRLFFQIMKKRIRMPGFSATNLGLLNNEEFQFNGLKIADSYIVASLKRNHSVQFTFSTFENSITISTFGNYTEKSRERINAIYQDMGKYIRFYENYGS